MADHIDRFADVARGLGLSRDVENKIANFIHVEVMMAKYPKRFRKISKKPLDQEIVYCGWCIRHPRAKANSDWEQMNLSKEWKPMCKRCANNRLNNPYNALLQMRKRTSPTLTH